MQCPICGRRFRRFLPYDGREGAVCPGCGSAERHRLLWLWLRERLPKSLLTFGPDDATDAVLRGLPLHYVSADIDATQAMVASDITSLPFEDNQFEAVICSHVLEHVADETAALRELRRVARDWVAVMVPVDASLPATVEGVADTPESRRSEYGQHDHVRVYGADTAQRLGAERVDLLGAADPERARRHGLVRHDRFGPDDLFLIRP